MSLRIKAVVDKFVQELKEAPDADVQDRIMKEREMQSNIEERAREVAEREAASKAELSRREVLGIDPKDVAWGSSSVGFMSFNQSRYQKSEAAQDRRTRRSASFKQQRTSSGGYSKGDGAPAPSPSISSNRSFKKPNKVQGGQSRVNVRPANISSEPTGATPTPTQHNLQNGAHVQPQPQSQGQSDAGHASPTAKPAETPPAVNRSTRAVRKDPTSEPPTMSSEVPPPSTPQKAPRDASKAFSFQFGSFSPGLMNGMQIPTSTSSAPPNLDEQKRDQARHDAIKACPQVPVPAAPEEKKEAVKSSRGAEIAAEDIHANQAAAETSPKEAVVSDDVEQTKAKFGGPRRTPVKIIHPETHQEVRLDKRTEGFSDGGPSSQSHSSVPPQAQHISSYPSNHPVNYFTNSYSPCPLFFPAPSSLPLSGTQITPTSQAPRFDPPVDQGAQRMTLRNFQDNSQLPERAGISIRAAVEPPKQDQVENAHAPPSALAQGGGASKPRIVSDGENITDLPSASVLTAFEKVESPKAVKISGNSASRDSEVPRGPLLKEPGSDLGALPAAGNAGDGDDDGVFAESVEGCLKSVQIAVPKDKPAPEISRSSSNISRGKKKRKEFLRKADAARATLDLHTAYKGPKEKKEAVKSSGGTVIASEDIHANQAAAETSPKEAMVSGDVEQTKAEIDDWEDAAGVSSPALEPSTSGQQVDVFVPSSENRNGFLARKYSRDFLLKFHKRCTNLPENFEVTHDIAETLLSMFPALLTITVLGKR